MVPVTGVVRVSGDILTVSTVESEVTRSANLIVIEDEWEFIPEVFQHLAEAAQGMHLYRRDNQIELLTATEGGSLHISPESVMVFLCVNGVEVRHIAYEGIRESDRRLALKLCDHKVVEEARRQIEAIGVNL